MLHKNRVWQIHEITSISELAEKLSKHDWCGCTGFKLHNYLFLNDSVVGSGEYAVVNTTTLKQVESITFGWCTIEEAIGYITQTLAGEFNLSCGRVEVKQLQTPIEHDRCELCM